MVLDLERRLGGQPCSDLGPLTREWRLRFARAFWCWAGDETPPRRAVSEKLFLKLAANGEMASLPGRRTTAEATAALPPQSLLLPQLVPVSGRRGGNHEACC
mmetsp:Transcript_55692/g.125736  ORF Transcript_55692/g.125736 Transcript_55692/m.125736 type:complete len:102 (-) Transcript_55692:152-457(-)